MLFHLFCWAAVGFPSLALGMFIEGHLSVIPFTSYLDRCIVSLYIGLLLFSTALLGLSLVVPISAAALCLTLTFGLAIALLDKPTLTACTNATSRLLNRRTITSIAVLFGLAAFGAADRIKVYDTGLYHYPLTQWLATTGTVPGMALLSENLGFGSAWFALAAGLDHGLFRARVAGVFNGLLNVMAILHFTLALARALQRRALAPDWFLLGAYPLIFLLCYKVNYASSLSPDFPVFLVTILISWRLIGEEYSQTQPTSFRANLSLLILASAIVDLKLSALPVFIVVLFLIFVRCRFQPRHVVPVIAVACVIILPIALSNVVTSGYALYPSPIFGLQLPWSVSPAAAAKAESVVTNWARCNGPCEHLASGAAWVIPWLKAPQNALMLLVSTSSLALFVSLKAWRFGAQFCWVLALGEGGVLYVLLTAPNMRFAAGYLAVCLGLCATLLSLEAPRSLTYKRRSIAYAIVIAVCLEMSYVAEPYAHGMAYTNAGWYLQLLLPSRLPAQTNDVAIVHNRHILRKAVLTLVPERVNGIRYVRPIANDQCWAANIPCVPGGIRPGIVFRIPAYGLRSGFARAGAHN